MHHNHIEPNRECSQLAPALQKLIGRAHDASLLGAIDAGRRSAEPLARAGADLGNHQHTGIARDDVELACAAQEIARDDREPSRSQEFECGGFCLRSRTLARSEIAWNAIGARGFGSARVCGYGAAGEFAGAAAGGGRIRTSPL